jgi:hypothetical protein
VLFLPPARVPSTAPGYDEARRAWERASHEPSTARELEPRWSRNGRYFVSGTATSSSMFGWSTISIRRFRIRPCGESFDATGSNSP